MTPEQVTRRMGWMYAMLGGGIACLYMAYDYTRPTVGISEPPPEFAPYLFGGLGIACLIAGAVLALQLKKEPTRPAKTDLKTPQGKIIIRLMAVGVAALIGTYFVGYVAPSNELTGILLNGGLLLVVAVCFVSAGQIARKQQRLAAAKGANKE